MITLKKKKEKRVKIDNLLQIKNEYPLAYATFKKKFEKLNEGKTDLFLSVLTPDTYDKDMFGAFLPFFLDYDIAVLNNFDCILSSFKLLNDRLSAKYN